METSNQESYPCEKASCGCAGTKAERCECGDDCNCAGGCNCPGGCGCPDAK